MSPIRITDTGGKKTEDWLKRMKEQDIFSALEKYGEMGVNALRAATPVEDGSTAAAWSYRITRNKDRFSIAWYNSAEAGGPLAIMLQYGHGTGTGGWVQGRDYINPAIRPIFDQIDAEIRKAVST